MPKPKKTSPYHAIGMKCQTCRGLSCNHKDCDLREYHPQFGEEIHTTSPLKAIKKHCVWCRGTEARIKVCPLTTCKIHPHRSGLTPKAKAYYC